MATASTTTSDLVLKPVPATPENLEGYGWAIGKPGGIDRDKIDFYGKEVEISLGATDGYRIDDDERPRPVLYYPQDRKSG